MDENVQVSFDIIGAVGTAKSCFIEAIRLVGQGQLEEAKQRYDEGEEAFFEGHKIHQSILTRFANGEEIKPDILLIHAECQMMSAEDFKTLAEELITYTESKEK